MYFIYLAHSIWQIYTNTHIQMLVSDSLNAVFLFLCYSICQQLKHKRNLLLLWVCHFSKYISHSHWICQWNQQMFTNISPSIQIRFRREIPFGQFHVPGLKESDHWINNPRPPPQMASNEEVQFPTRCQSAVGKEKLTESRHQKGAPTISDAQNNPFYSLKNEIRNPLMS